MYKRWTENELDILIEIYPTAKMCDMIRIFGRNDNKIHLKANKLGLKRGKSIGKRMDSINGYMTVSDYSTKTGIPKSSIYRYIKDGGIESIKIGTFNYVKVK